MTVMFTVAVCASLLGIVFNITTTNARFTRHVVDRSVAVAFGDAVQESLFDQWRAAMIATTDPTSRADGLRTSDLSGVTAPSATVLPRPPGITLVSATLRAGTPYLQELTASSARPTPENGTTSRFRVRLNYISRVTVQFPGPTGNNRVVVQRAFVRAGRNIFDNFFFGTLPATEFHPGPPMYVDGPVYCGGDLYTAHDSLVFLKDVTFQGKHTINYRPNDPRVPTDPNIDDNGLNDNWDPNNPPKIGVEQKLLDTPRTSLDPNFLDDPIGNDSDSDGNSNNNGYRELIEEPSSGADPLQIDTATNERLSTNADYRIYISATNAVTIYRGTSAAALSASNPQYIAINNALTKNHALKDVRDGDNVRYTAVNVAQIKTATDSGTLADNNGGSDGMLLYLRDNSVGTPVVTQVVDSVTGASVPVTSNRSRGFKIQNGASLPTGGLTIASPNPIYIQGDYNTGSTSTAQPASNTATSYTPPIDTPSPVVTGYNRAPSAIVGDAVNILSNAWNDANSLLGQSSRTARSTTINCAIVAGNVPTTSSSYSGGIENFARFHEDWGNDYLTIHGALAQLYSSQQATQPWSSADYSPPARRWYFDTLLQDNNPPGFRVARVYSRGLWSLP